MGIHDLDGVMITLGEDYGSELAPQFDSSRNVVLAPNETVVTEFESRVGFWPDDAGLKSRGVAAVVVLKLPTHVMVTTERVVAHWRNIRRDRSAGSFFERRLMSKLLDRAEGPSVIAAQMPYRYINMVDLRQVREVRRGAGDANKLDVWVGMEYAGRERSSTAMWQFLDVPRDRAAQVANAIVTAASDCRLAAAQDSSAALSDEARTMLKANRGHPRAQHIDGGVRYLVPGGTAYTG